MTTPEEDLCFHRTGKILHISFQKEPDQRMFQSMSIVLKEYENDTDRLFLDVRKLSGSLSQQTVSSMRSVLEKSRMPAKSVYFKGEAGFALAGSGNRVLIFKKSGDKKNETRAAAQKRFAQRPHKCTCGGRCGDKCCQVTGGPCCKDKKSA